MPEPQPGDVVTAEPPEGIKADPADVTYYREIATLRAPGRGLRSAFFLGALGSAARQAINAYDAGDDAELRRALTTAAAIMEAAQ